MTTSGVTATSSTEQDIIEGALRIVTSEDQPSAEQYLYARKALNLLLKTWQTHYGLWLKQEVTLFTAPDQNKYALPGANGSTTIVDTLTASDLTDAASVTVLTLDDTTGMTAGDYIGVQDDNGELHWDTIHSVDSTIQVTVHTGFQINAEAPAQVWTYTTGLYRPTRVFQAVRRNESGYDVPLALYSRQEYMALPNKTANGVPVGVFYDPQTLVGYVYVWPTPFTSDDRIILTIDRQLQIGTATTETLDLPEEWLEPLKFGLAYRLCFEYGITRANSQFIQQEYQLLMDAVLNNSRDWAPTFFGVARY